MGISWQELIVVLLIVLVLFVVLGLFGEQLAPYPAENASPSPWRAH